GELNELSGNRLQSELFGAGCECERASTCGLRRDGLQYGAHRCDYDERCFSTIVIADEAQRFGATPNSFGGWAQAFVRERLPRGKLRRYRLRDEALQFSSHPVCFTTRRGNNEVCTVVSRRASATNEPRDEGRPDTVPARK